MVKNPIIRILVIVSVLFLFININSGVVQGNIYLDGCDKYNCFCYGAGSVCMGSSLNREGWCKLPSCDYEEDICCCNYQCDDCIGSSSYCSKDTDCCGLIKCSNNRCCPDGETYDGSNCVVSGPETCEDAGNTAEGDTYCTNLNPNKPLCCGAAGSGHCEECCNRDDCGFCERCATGGGQGTWNCVYQSASADLKNECPGPSAYTCDTICQRSRLSGDCDGAGACETETDYTTASYVCSGGNEIFPTASDNCGVDTSNCNAGACSATIYYRACQANNGICRSDNNGATTATITANSGRSLTNTCGVNGNTLCDNTWRCGTGSGNNNYGNGGQYSCQGLCDGSGTCDYATNCANCGAGTCTDSGDAWNIQETVTVSGGCASGTCIAGSTDYNDYCEASGNNVVHDRQCNGNSLGTDATADCDNADTNTCWCTASTSTLTEDCNDWDCNTGRCRDSGSNYNRNTWNCGAWRQCTSETCQGNDYTCYRTNNGIWNWSSTAEPTETACTDTYDNDCDGDVDRMDCDCGVSITSITAPPTADSGEVITVECGSSVGPTNCISATISGRNCTWTGAWNGNNAVFNCGITNTCPTTETARCFVDNRCCALNPSEMTSNVNVACGNCNDYSTQANCEDDTRCDWCQDCENDYGGIYSTSLKYWNEPDQCMNTGNCDPGTPDYYCYLNKCTAECDTTRGGCNTTTRCNPVTNIYETRTWNCEANCTCTYGNWIPGTCTESMLYCTAECNATQCEPGCTGRFCNATCKWEDMPPESNCVDDADNDCDCLIDGEDGSDCPEGSGIDVSSTHRQCTDGANSDSWNDLPDPPLIDSDDDGCCDICISDGYQFDTAGGARDACAATPDPACDCGTLTLNWESGTTPYCCGDEVPVNEFYRTTTDYDWQPDYTCNTTFGPCPHHACCNESYHCIDELGRCQNGTEELCLDGLDNDCNGLIDVYDPQCRGRVWGYVFDEGRFPIPGATVKGSPPGMPKVFEREATTNAAGMYDIPDAIIGNYSFISRKEGYDDSVKILFIIPNSDQQVNFTLRNGSCHFDCTDYHGNCNPKCDGLVFGPTENCTIISLLCEHRPKGFVVTEPFTTGGVDMIREYTCCEGVPEGTYREYEKRPATVGGDIDDLIDSTFIIKKGGRDIILHIVVTPPLG